MSKQGGDLNDFAKDGTSIPGDAGKMNVLPSVPNPHQARDASDGLGAPDLASAADNPTDMPRNPRDMGTAGGADMISGSGHTIAGDVNTKHTHFSGGNPLAKGSDRYDKHTRDKEGAVERGAQAGAGVVPAPGEEGKSQDEIRDAKGL